MSNNERKHTFKNSPFFKFDDFAAALPTWPESKQRFYHEAAVMYSEAQGSGKMYANWIAAVQNWDRMKPEKWREFKCLKQAIVKLSKIMTIQEVMDLRQEGYLPENACWCCGTPWVERGGSWFVGCKCTHWSKAIGRAIMCPECKRCLECCPGHHEQLELAP